ncbi:hypothetical protein UFOVP1375_35 [uncultured Caudovirales phage]|uniref:Uncharacterized protein n=1 Tax=uncultured Caudovirales phage TaxID=2100421 RepID=A0A6J5RW41_9CAUD|nr:hypothetical protein UFOVP1107_16 [uncultured Caudovirales phage]CAB4187880.1 hypothetical protein UFOVP1171_20 [uncultured Caudovirales phage]CAB4202792.1 hypothetical protein UFOVP1375_35 [uncultured Caudovirales phage]CAB4214782.1 hypothetical protein UFOVP1471_11 [uncultured Caudovirales phage]
MTRTPIKNDVDALAEALRLAIIAPTEEMHNMALEFARDFAVGMTNRQVQKAKRIAFKATA